MQWLIAALHEPVVALVQLAVSTVALEVARRARRRAKSVERDVQALGRRRSRSSSKPPRQTRSPDLSPQATLTVPSADDSDGEAA